MLSSHVVSDVERACDYLIVLVDSRVQLAGDIETCWPRTTGSPARGATSRRCPSDQHVVSASHTDRQTTLLVRTEARSSTRRGRSASSPWRTSSWRTWRADRGRRPARSGGAAMIWLTWRQFRMPALRCTPRGAGAAPRGDGRELLDDYRNADHTSSASCSSSPVRAALYLASAVTPFRRSSAPSGARPWSRARSRPAPTGSCGTRASAGPAGSPPSSPSSVAAVAAAALLSLAVTWWASPIDTMAGHRRQTSTRRGCLR